MGLCSLIRPDLAPSDVEEARRTTSSVKAVQSSIEYGIVFSSRAKDHTTTTNAAHCIDLTCHYRFLGHAVSNIMEDAAH